MQSPPLNMHEGFFTNLPNGKGRIMFPDSYIVGDFSNPQIIIGTKYRYKYNADFNCFFRCKVYTGDFKRITKDDTQLITYHGIGKRFLPSGEIQCKGEFKDNQFIGGSVFNESGQLIYQGGMMNCRAHGKGIAYHNESPIIDGNFHDGIPVNAIRYNDKGVLIGSYNNTLYTGEGVLIYSNGKIKFEGKFVDGDIVYGSLFNKFGNKIYTGLFKDWTPHGYGTIFYRNSFKRYEGQIVNCRPEGEGTLYAKNGSITYQGKFKDGSPEIPNLNPIESNIVVVIVQMLNARKHTFEMPDVPILKRKRFVK